MERDMDLIRLILLRQEGSEVAAQKIDELYPPGDEATGYHQAHQIAILIDAGFIVGDTLQDQNGIVVGGAILRLTWAGHEFLDTIREDRVWDRTKERVLKPGASWTISILLEVAKAEIRKHIGLP